MDRFNDGSNLYGNSIITSFDPGHLPKVNGGTSGKTISVENKIKDDDNILMNSSIKKVMQKNRELHKELYLEREKNKKLEAENKSLSNKLKKIKNKE